MLDNRHKQCITMKQHLAVQIRPILTLCLFTCWSMFNQGPKKVFAFCVDVLSASERDAGMCFWEGILNLGCNSSKPTGSDSVVAWPMFRLNTTRCSPFPGPGKSAGKWPRFLWWAPQVLWRETQVSDSTHVCRAVDALISPPPPCLRVEQNLIGLYLFEGTLVGVASYNGKPKGKPRSIWRVPILSRTLNSLCLPPNPTQCFLASHYSK